MGTPWPRDVFVETVWASDLPSVQKLIAIAYADHARQGDVAWIHYPRLMQRASCSRDTVARSVRALVDAGWLVLTESAGQHRSVHYQLIPGGQQSDGQTSEEVQQSDQQTAGPSQQSDGQTSEEVQQSDQQTAGPSQQSDGRTPEFQQSDGQTAQQSDSRTAEYQQSDSRTPRTSQQSDGAVQQSDGAGQQSDGAPPTIIITASPKGKSGDDPDAAGQGAAAAVMAARPDLTAEAALNVATKMARWAERRGDPIRDWSAFLANQSPEAITRWVGKTAAKSSRGPKAGPRHLCPGGRPYATDGICGCEAGHIDPQWSEAS